MSERNAADPGLNEAAVAALGRFGGKRGQQALALVAAVQVSAPAIKWAKGKLDRREDYTITVGGQDEVYADLHEWVLERIPTIDRKAMIANTLAGPYRINSCAPDGPPLPQRVRLRYDGSRVQSFQLDGCRITAEISKESIPGGVANVPVNWRSMLETIKFTSSSVAGRDAVVRVIDELAQAKEEKPGPPPLMVPSRWGGDWHRRNDLPPRKLDSVVLRAEQLERLVEDLETFLSAEKVYGRMSQPWHRGYLLHGAPGTGKTSVARALANHFEMPLHYLPLGDLEQDADLMSLVGAIPPKSMLLLEDIDVYHAMIDREEVAKKASLAAMLNALDGIWTPHGLVTVMTTNDKSAIDPALLRAGRVDVDEEFKPLNQEQAQRLFLQMTGTAIGYRGFIAGQSPAEYIQAIRAKGAR
jgi:hypothetical protein